MNDLAAFLIASLLVSALITAVTFAFVGRLTRKRTPLFVISTGVFPTLMIGLAVYIPHFGFDPHGFAMAIYTMIAVASLPATALTAWLLARQFA